MTKPPLRVVGDEPPPDAEPGEQFFLIVADHDQGFFSVEGPMTDDAPWKNAARHARDNLHRRIVCGPSRPGSSRARRRIPAHRKNLVVSRREAS